MDFASRFGDLISEKMSSQSELSGFDDNVYLMAF